MIILDRQEIINQRVANGHTEKSPLFLGTKKTNVDNSEPQIVEGSMRSIEMGSKQYKDSEAYNKIWNEIEDLHSKMKKNVATFPESDYYTLLDRIRIDVTRRRFEYPDLTGLINEEITNYNFSKSVLLNEFLPFGAWFDNYSMQNDSVPLIDQKTGSQDSVAFSAYACGWKDNLENKLYNTDIFSLQRVNDAVARGYVARRNDLSAGQIVGATYHASQQQAAQTGYDTPEEDLYVTMDLAIEQLLGLRDPQTGQYINAPSISCLCCPSDVRRLNRALNGQLNNAKGKVANREALSEITSLIPYNGDTIYVGKKAYTTSGVTKGECYLYVPRVAGYTLTKRPLTQEIGMGSVLQLSTQEMAWYFVHSSYMAEFFGSSDAGVFAKVGAGYGFVVKVTLPTVTEDT